MRETGSTCPFGYFHEFCSIFWFKFWKFPGEEALKRTNILAHWGRFSYSLWYFGHAIVRCCLMSNRSDLTNEWLVFTHVVGVHVSRSHLFCSSTTPTPLQQCERLLASFFLLLCGLDSLSRRAVTSRYHSNKLQDGTISLAPHPPVIKGVEVHEGEKKQRNFFNMNFLAPTQNLHFGAQKGVYVPQLLGKDANKDPHKLCSWGFSSAPVHPLK